ncbi:MAG: M48 family metalloprotease [Ignavibacteriales bacterium]|nr:M48 family metalloprotease [Ignavibacteriales bacterium]
MNLILQSRDVAAQKRRNKTQTLLVMGGFSLSFALLGCLFDYMMTTFNNYQLLTVPIAAVIIISLIFNWLDGLNERFSDHDDPKDAVEYYSNKVTIWMASTSCIIMFWMVLLELAYIDPRNFAKPTALLVIGETSPYGLIVGACLGVGAAFSALQWGAYSILRSVGASPADRSFEGDRRVIDIVEDVSKAAGISAPGVFVVQDDAPNLFSIGRSPKHASLVVSQGLIENLSPEEIKGAIAHEISHIRSYDIRLRTAATALFGSVVLLTRWSRPTTIKGGTSSIVLSRIRAVRKFLVFVFWLLSMLVVPVVTYVLVVLTFRHREFLADASAAELTHDPGALARALNTIEHAAGDATVLRGNIAHLCIIDPLNRDLTSKEGWLADLLATHPPTAKRLLVLRSMGARFTSSPSVS